MHKYLNVKKIELGNEIVGFSALIIFFNFFNELTIKCVVRFGGFVKISRVSWKILVNIRLGNR
jgi:hypothetical protein